MNKAETAQTCPAVTTLTAWAEWRDRCALGLCGADTQDALQQFAAMHFKQMLSRYAHRTNAPEMRARPSARECWHLLETHMTIRDNRQGKRYKEWLFARSRNSAATKESVESGAALLIRDVTRELLRREYSPPSMMSLNAPVCDSANAALTLEDLLPGVLDPADETARRELERLAAYHARAVEGKLGRRERMVVLARSLGVPLSHPAVEKAMGCRKSVVSSTYRATLEGIVSMLRTEYEGEDEDSLRLLTLMIFDHLRDRVREWAGTTPSCRPLLALLEVKP